MWVFLSTVVKTKRNIRRGTGEGGTEHPKLPCPQEMKHNKARVSWASEAFRVGRRSKRSATQTRIARILETKNEAKLKRKTKNKARKAKQKSYAKNAKHYVKQSKSTRTQINLNESANTTYSTTLRRGRHRARGAQQTVHYKAKKRVPLRACCLTSGSSVQSLKMVTVSAGISSSAINSPFFESLQCTAAVAAAAVAAVVPAAILLL